MENAIVPWEMLKFRGVTKIVSGSEQPPPDSQCDRLKHQESSKKKLDTQTGVQLWEVRHPYLLLL